MIYDGIVNWKEADGIVTVKCPDGENFIVRLDEHSTNKTICAIALFENNGNNILSVEKIVKFFGASKDMDDAFHWGLVWTHGKK
jgi:tellurite resistance protein TerA